MKRFFKKSWLAPIFAEDAWPVLTYLGLVLLLIITNYQAGTILSGWDNLHPEFDFALNIRRSLFAVWQEYQGLGLLGGMAHSTDLLRQLFLYAFSFILPSDLLRYFWTFLMLFTGAMGTYFFIKVFIVTKSNSKLMPFLGGLFYLFNLATIQMFYVPFEAFIGFYGFLPWLLLASLLYFQKSTTKRLTFLIITLFITTPAWYLQTLFVVFMLALSIILLPSLVKNFTRQLLLKAVKLYLIILLVNSFWLLPAAYFTLNYADVNINSKINQMATETIFMQNKEFGTLQDVALLKGFMFKGVDPNYSGTITYMLKPWSDHLNNPVIALSGLLLFAVVLVGFVSTIKSRNSLLWGFSALFIFSFIALAIDTFPFSFINNILRDNIRILNQIFRFPFTKFSTLASFGFAVLFAIGAKELIKRNQKIPYILGLLIFLVIFPVFKGHLFYEKERAKIPPEYHQLFDFFKKQDPNSRIANFPQSTFWGWSFYNWPHNNRPKNNEEKSLLQNAGYSGSGFLWYGIRQPILDRAFDVWSRPSENYYFEVTHALYSRNQLLFEKVLNKYQAQWLIVDKNVFDASSNKVLFVTELEEMLANSSFAEKTASFGKIDVYKIKLSDNPKSFVFMSKNLPSVNEYTWNNYDRAYFDTGTYINAPQEANDNFALYPFRSLSTSKSQDDKEFTVQEENATIAFINKLPPNPGSLLILPAFTKTERIIPVQIRSLRTQGSSPIIEAKVLLPQIIVGTREIQKSTGPVFQTQLPPIDSTNYPLSISINGATYSPISNNDQDVGVAFFILNEQNTLTVSDNTKKTVSDIVFASDTFSNLQNSPQSMLLTEKAEQSLTVRFPKIDAHYMSFRPLLKDAEQVRNCDNFKGKNFTTEIIANRALILKSKGATACTSFFAQNLPHDQGFAAFIKSTHVKGQSLRFWVENTNQQTIPLDTFLPKDEKETTSSFIIPPMEQFGNSYAFHFYSSSIGRNETINELNSLSVHPIFYEYLKSIQIKSDKTTTGELINTSGMKVSHPNESLYIINNLPAGNGQEKETIILSQSFDPGWKAYAMTDSKWPIINSLKHTFPFVFGKEVKKHVKANNWANGWVLDNQELGTKNQELVIVYLPQYLQYIGFLLPLALLFGIFQRRRVDKRG
jgi:hypothetical protein